MRRHLEGGGLQVVLLGNGNIIHGMGSVDVSLRAALLGQQSLNKRRTAERQRARQRFHPDVPDVIEPAQQRKLSTAFSRR
jgi:hypothetical protein